MDASEFWSLVEATRGAAATRRGSAVEQHVTTLTQALQALPDAAVVDFDRHLTEALSLAFRWDLWAAGYVAMGGMSDDSFLDFRTWLVSHGHEVFARVVADPDSLVDLSWDEEGEDFGVAEEWGHVPQEVLRGRGARRAALTCDDLRARQGEGEPVGEPFPEDDETWFAARLPRLSARYGAADEQS